MKSEAEITIENYKKMKKVMLDYATLTSNSEINIGIETFVENADAYIEAYEKIKKFRGHGEIFSIEGIIEEKEEDKISIEQLKSYMEEKLGDMSSIYEEMKEVKVSDVERENYSNMITAMYLTIELFRYTMGVAVNKKPGNGYTKEISSLPKRNRRVIDYSYI